MAPISPLKLTYYFTKLSSTRKYFSQLLPSWCTTCLTAREIKQWLIFAMFRNFKQFFLSFISTIWSTILTCWCKCLKLCHLNLCKFLSILKFMLRVLRHLIVTCKTYSKRVIVVSFTLCNVFLKMISCVLFLFVHVETSESIMRYLWHKTLCVCIRLCPCTF